MIVYVETNFLLELAYEKKTSGCCEEILSLAEAGRIQLVVPAFSLMECRFSDWNAYRVRKKFGLELRREVRHLREQLPYTEAVDSGKDLLTALARVSENDRRRILELTKRVLNMEIVQPMTGECIERGMKCEKEHGLGFQDAIIYASVLTHLGQQPKQTPKCFLNHNSWDFDKKAMGTELGEYNCKMFFTFERGLEYIKYSLAKAA